MNARLLSLLAFPTAALSAAAPPASLDVSASPPAPAVSVFPTPGSPYGRRIAELHYEPASLPPAQLSLRTGQTLTPENLSLALQDIVRHLGRQADRLAAANGGRTLSFTYVDAAFDLPPKNAPGSDAVGVTLRPFHLEIPLDDTGARILPVPRDFLFTLFLGRERPCFLPATVTLATDRVSGPTLGARWQFQAGAASGNDEGASRLFRFRAGATRSLDSPLYSANGDAQARRTWSSGVLREVAGGFEGRSATEPRGTGRYDFRRWGATVAAAFAFNASTRLQLDTRLHAVRHRPAPDAGPAGWLETREQSNRVLFETIPPQWLGFLRGAIWQENLDPKNTGSARRLVGRAGYAREFVVGAHQSVGVELVAGAGQTWGPVDAPRRFFAGGGQGEFLYESATSAGLALPPDGPLLRSLGKAQGGLRSSPTVLRGGTRFWHVNLNLSLPIPAWSRPLIPNVQTDLPGPDGAPQTLKQILRTQVDRTGPNLLQSTLQLSDGLSPAEARRRADAIFHEIRPATYFVIEQANVFAVKPLLLFDAAGLEGPAHRSTWTAAGAGLQLVVVTARFEAGYMHTLSGPRFGARGNLFGRLGFERLF